MNQPQAEGNFCNEKNNALKLSIVKYYNKQKGYYEKSDQMANSYSMIQRTKKLLFLLFTERRKFPNHPSHRLAGESNNESALLMV